MTYPTSCLSTIPFITPHRLGQVMVLVVDTSLCEAEQCGTPCLNICPQVKKGKAGISIRGEFAVISEKYCVECLRCVEVCPTRAIKPKEVTGQEHDTVHELVDQKLSDSQPKIAKLPFEMDNDIYDQFGEYDTVFARVQWDTSFEGYQKEIFSRSKERASQGYDGYSEVELAAVQASWAVEDMVTHLEIGELKEGLVSPVEEKTTPMHDFTSKELTQWVKKVAKVFGADLVGVTAFDPRWVYTNDRGGEEINLPDNLTFAVVIAVEMDLDAINTSPKMPSGIATGLGYSKSAFVRSLLTSFIRNMGYQAVPAGNQLGLSVPLAVMAGLGGYGRTGLLITKKFGPRVRLAKIFTDMPLIPDEPDHQFVHSVERFCKTCMTCAKACPSASISMEKEPSYETYSKSNNPGVRKWYVNVDTCYQFWVENGVECSRCISDCEYNRTNRRTLGGHAVTMWLISHVPWLNRLWPLMGRVTGFGGNKSAKKYWREVK